MTNALVGYTGFVGSNICFNHKFDFLYNTKNIDKAFGTKPDILYYAGIRAEKYLANSDPEKDFKNICEARSIINKINPKKLVLISTVDVYPVPINVNEDTVINNSLNDAYGLNRYKLESMIRSDYPDALIVRLPALFGINIKKNFIYDCLNPIPKLLKESKLQMLISIREEIANYYQKAEYDFYRLKELNDDEKKKIISLFKDCYFDARYFTDSRNTYQYYPLHRLYNDIQIALKYKLNLLNINSEPVSISRLYFGIYNEEFKNEFLDKPVSYDYRTKYASLFGGEGEYMIKADEVIKEIKEFIDIYDKK